MGDFETGLEALKTLLNEQQTIDSLIDVTITGTPADNEILGWDTASGKWINQTAAELGLAGGVTGIDDLSDVTITTPATRHALIHNGAGQFVNRLLVEADISDLQNYALVGHTQLLSTISDVTITVANLNILDNGVNTTLHFHDADRARAVHTGTQLALTISNFDTQVRTNRLDQMAVPTGAVAYNGQQITGLANPSLAQDAATKAYVDTTVASNVTLIGDYNAATNTPDLDTAPSGINQGDHYVVSVAGVFFTANVEAGDSIIAKQTNPTLESHWIITQTNLDAASVKVLYETNADTNAYDDAAVSKLGGIATGANLYVHPNHSGDVTSVADGATTISVDVVTYAKIQNVVADNVLLGNVAGAGGIVAELTGANVNLILPVFTSTLNGLVPLSGGGTTNFLRADGTFAAPAGGGGLANIVEDLTPELGGNLDALTKNITNIGLLNILTANTTAVFELEANHTTPADAQVVGRMAFIDDNSIGGREIYGEIRTLIQTPTSTTEDGEMFVSVMKGGTLTDYLSINEADGNTIKTNVAIEFANVSLPGVTVMYIGSEADDMVFHVSIGDVFRMRIAGASQYTFGATDADFAGNNLKLVGIFSFADANTSIQQATADLQIDVATGGATVLRVNNVIEYDFDAAQADWNTNNLIGMKSLQYTQNTITYAATLAFDFDSNEKNQITLTGVLSTLTTSNRAAGKSKQIFIIGDTVDRVLTFNTSWKTNPSTATVTVTANTFGVLSLYCRGTAETDVFAVYAEFS